MKMGPLRATLGIRATCSHLILQQDRLSLHGLTRSIFSSRICHSFLFSPFGKATITVKNTSPAIEMASSKKVELIDQAIQALQTEKRDHNDQLFLSNLLSELESLKVETKEEGKEVASCCSNKIDAEEVVKELKGVRKQNVVTHCLLSVMIVLTLAWQLSEVSLILKVKDGLRHPFRSFGSVLAGMLKPPGQGAEDAEEKQENESSSGPVPGFKIPEMNLDFNSGKQ